jgi:hypothetical protein
MRHRLTDTLVDPGDRQPFKAQQTGRIINHARGSSAVHVLA